MRIICALALSVLPSGAGYTPQTALNEQMGKRTSWFYSVKQRVPRATDFSCLCYRDATGAGVTPTSVTLVQTMICLKYSRGNSQKKKNTLNKTSLHHIQNQRGTPKHQGIWMGRWIHANASTWSKHNSIYLIVPLVSLVSSAPLRDYRPFLIWKTKTQYSRTLSVVMSACSHASFSH